MTAENVRTLTNGEIREIAETYVDYAFSNGEENLFSLLGDREDIIRYQAASLKMALKAGWIWTIGDDRQAYIAITTSEWKPPFSLLVKFPFIVMKSVRLSSLTHMLKLVRSAGPSLADMMKKNKEPFVNVTMLCVRKPYQGKGYMRQALDVAKSMAEKKGIPCVLETDEMVKVEKYRHLGMTLAGIRHITPTMTLYDMIWYPS